MHRTITLPDGTDINYTRQSGMVAFTTINEDVPITAAYSELSETYGFEGWISK